MKTWQSGRQKEVVKMEWIPLLFWSIMTVVPIVVVIWGIVTIRSLKRKVVEIEKQINDISNVEK